MRVCCKTQHGERMAFILIIRLVQQGGREVDIKALLDLLSPTGRLFREMQRADADELIQFMFPVERLPTHTQVLWWYTHNIPGCCMPIYTQTFSPNHRCYCHCQTGVHTLPSGHSTQVASCLIPVVDANCTSTLCATFCFGLHLQCSRVKREMQQVHCWISENWRLIRLVSPAMHAR